MAETVVLGYLAVSKDTVMVTSMKADFFEKKVGVPGEPWISQFVLKQNPRQYSMTTILLENPYISRVFGLFVLLSVLQSY